MASKAYVQEEVDTRCPRSLDEAFAVSLDNHPGGGLGKKYTETLIYHINIFVYHFFMLMAELTTTLVHFFIYRMSIEAESFPAGIAVVLDVAGIV